MYSTESPRSRSSTNSISFTASPEETRALPSMTLFRGRIHCSSITRLPLPPCQHPASQVSPSAAFGPLERNARSGTVAQARERAGSEILRVVSHGSRG